MNILSYNILDGGLYRIPLILKVIKKASPDFLAIQEANIFFDDNQKILKQFSIELELQYFDISKSPEGYHVASFSKYPFKQVSKLQGFRNACLQVVIETELGEISISNTHLHPYEEEIALNEISGAIEAQKDYRNRITLGDLNSLSPEDNYQTALMESFNDIQIKKFTENGKFRFRVISELLSNDYVDSAVSLNKNKLNTVPTKSATDEAHMALIRLDDIFVSNSLATHLKLYEVIKTNKSDQASDHYPVRILLE